MRLYRIIARHGHKRQRFWWWFEPPEAGAPVRYDGWFWDPANKEWMPIEMAPMKLVVTYQLYPKPTKMPSREFSSEQPGWSYSFTKFEWVRTVVMAEPVDFTPPRSLPPWVTQKAVFELYSWEQLYLEEVNTFIAQGYTMEAAKRITRNNFDNLLRILWAKQAAANKSAWKVAVEGLGKDPDFMRETVLVYGAVIIIAAVIGALIGDIMERFTFRDIDAFTLKEPIGVYLMRYDHYVYSKNVGVTTEGRRLYSACDDIGTSYIRHRRPRGRKGVDIIDFPGGFVEEGHKGVYFVKYTWRAWTLEYIGFLVSVGANLYALKEGEVDPYVDPSRPFGVDASRWCPDFRWYL